MKTKYNKSLNMVALRNLGRGEVFVENGGNTAYMITKVLAKLIDAINLNTGELWEFEPDSQVTFKSNATFYIDG